MAASATSSSQARIDADLDALVGEMASWMDLAEAPDDDDEPPRALRAAPGYLPPPK